MTKYPIIMFIAFAVFITSEKLLAFGGMAGVSTPKGGYTGSFGYSFTLNIDVPYGPSLRPAIIVPTTPVIAPAADFDATQIPVHKLPPLPLTLDALEETD
jgi:hypothetical protein